MKTKFRPRGSRGKRIQSPGCLGPRAEVAKHPPHGSHPPLRTTRNSNAACGPPLEPNWLAEGKSEANGAPPPPL
eukprot:5541360-Amphidinium_carterae.1